MIVLDGALRPIETVYWGNLSALDGAIKHSGDERRGHVGGDDEEVRLNLQRLPPQVRHLAIIINSYSNVPLGKVEQINCHLFDRATKNEMCEFRLSGGGGSGEIAGATGVLLGVLSRDSDLLDWVFTAISRQVPGNVAKMATDDTVKYVGSIFPAVANWPPPPPEPVRPMTDKEGIDRATKARETKLATLKKRVANKKKLSLFASCWAEVFIDSNHIRRHPDGGVMSGLVYAVIAALVLSTLIIWCEVPSRVEALNQMTCESTTRTRSHSPESAHFITAHRQ